MARAQQVSRLDLSISSYRNDMESQLRAAKEQLAECQDELQAKLKLVSNALVYS